MKTILRIKGLKCDNPACSWQDISIKYEDYENWINKPCPICGSNLLTQKDYDTIHRLMKISNSGFIRFIDFVLVHFFKAKRYVYDLGMDGSGTIKSTKVSEEEVKEDDGRGKS